MEQYTWYATLTKPSWAPPAYLFGPVWTFLYVIIAVSFGYVLYAAFKGQIPLSAATPFIINLIANTLFTPIQFGLKSNLLASLDILVVLGSLVWALVVIYPIFKWVAIVNVPYLAWVLFATGLQLTITYLNW